MFEKLVNSIINNGMVLASEEFSKYILKIDPYNRVSSYMQDYLFDNFINKSNRNTVINEVDSMLYSPMKYYKMDKYNYIVALNYISYLIPKDIEVSDDFELEYEDGEDLNTYICKVNRPKNFYNYYNFVDGTQTKIWIVGLNPEAKLQEIIDYAEKNNKGAKKGICPSVYYNGEYVIKNRSQSINDADLIDNLNMSCIPDGLYEMREFVVGELNEVFKIIIVDNGGYDTNDIVFKIASNMDLYVINHIDKINSTSLFKVNGLDVVNNIDEWQPNKLKYIEDNIRINNLAKSIVETVSDINLLTKERIDSYHVIIYSNALTRKDAENYCDYCKVNHKILDLIKFPIDIKILNKYILNIVSSRH